MPAHLPPFILQPPTHLILPRSPMTPRIRPVWICAPLAVIAILLMVPPAAFGGGDEQQAPPSAGPRGPWDGPSGKKVPYRPSGTHRCGIDKVRGAGPGSVLGLYVERARCRDATRLVRAYQSCLDDAKRPGRRVLRPRLPPLRPAGVPGALPHVRPLLPADDQGLPLHGAAAVPDRGRLRRQRRLRQGRAADRSQLHAFPGHAGGRRDGVGAEGRLGQPALQQRSR